MDWIKKFNIEFENYYKDYYKSLSYEFNEWLKGIEEDTPLPYEIKLVTFIIIKTSSLYSISYSGHEDEKLEKMHSGPFHPLEGQYFFNKYIMSINFLSRNETLKRSFIINLLKNLLTDFLKIPESKFLSGKKLAIGFAFDKPKVIM